MERFTNNRNIFITQLESELFEYKLDENYNEIFIYSEIPYFLSYAFSYHYSLNPKTLKYRMVKKEWNAEYDNTRFNKGIFNLDRIAVIEKEILLDFNEENFLKLINWKNINTLEFKGIVLDGLMCKLQIENKKILTWNINDEMNTELKKLIFNLRNWNSDES